MRFAARPLADSATHWGAAKTLLSACRSRLSIFRRTDSVSSKAADAVVASGSALVSGRFISSVSLPKGVSEGRDGLGT